MKLTDQLKIQRPVNNTWRRTKNGKKYESRLDFVLRNIATMGMLEQKTMENSDHDMLIYTYKLEEDLRKMRNDKVSAAQTTRGLIEDPEKYMQLKTENTKPSKHMTDILSSQYSEKRKAILENWKNRFLEVQLDEPGARRELWKIIRKKDTSWINEQQK